MTPEAFAARAISVPFRPRGRGWSGWDCWGLVTVYYAEVLGIRLPSHDTGYQTAGDTNEDRAAIAALAQAGLPAWRRVEQAGSGDLLVLRCFGRPIHAGVMIDAARFLHAEKGAGTIIERVSSRVWSRRIEGAYRYAAD